MSKTRVIGSPSCPAPPSRLAVLSSDPAVLRAFSDAVCPFGWQVEVVNSTELIENWRSTEATLATVVVDAHANPVHDGRVPRAPSCPSVLVGGFLDLHGWGRWSWEASTQKPLDATRALLLVHEVMRERDRLQQQAATVPLASISDSESWAQAIALRHRLTPRQTQCFHGLLEGKTDEVIASELGISATRVRQLGRAVCEKLGVAGRAGLLRLVWSELEKNASSDKERTRCQAGS